MRRDRNHAEHPEPEGTRRGGGGPEHPRRWNDAYFGDHAFVHALDTVNKTAVCIDLPHAAPKVRDWSLTLDGTALMATSPTTGMAVKIHTRRFTAKLLPANDSK